MSTDAMEDACVEAVEEMASAILQAVNDALQRHGDDPFTGAIATAGFALAIERIGERIDPEFPRIMRKMLEQ